MNISNNQRMSNDLHINNNFNSSNVSINNGNCPPSQKCAVLAKIALVTITAVGLLLAARSPAKMGALFLKGKTPLEWLVGTVYLGGASGLIGSAINSVYRAKSSNMFKATHENLADCKKYILNNLKITILATLGSAIVAPGLVLVTVIALANLKLKFSPAS
jgi:hypothetical protein